VVAEYKRQFALGGIQDYRLGKLSVTAGWVGRVTSSYTVPRSGGRSFGGTVTFGVSRVNGDVRIGLIATQTQG
jgi:hypothetical protein